MTIFSIFYTSGKGGGFPILQLICIQSVLILIRGGHFDQERSTIFGKFTSPAGQVRSCVLAKNSRLRISDFWPKLPILLKQQIRFVLVVFDWYECRFQ